MKGTKIFIALLSLFCLIAKMTEANTQNASPDNPMLAQNLARCYFSQGKFDFALLFRAMLYLRTEKMEGNIKRIQ